jgi:hypothetical protein
MIIKTKTRTRNLAFNFLRCIWAEKWWFLISLSPVLCVYAIAVSSRDFIRLDSSVYTVKEIARKVNRLAYYRVSNPWQTPLDYEVSVNEGDYKVSDLLNVVMDSTDIGWRYRDKGSVELYVFQESSMVRYKGKVVDSKTGAPLPYVEIITDENWGTISDAQGNFLLDLDKPRTTIWVLGDDRRQMLQIMADEADFGQTIDMDISVEQGSSVTQVLDDNFLDNKKDILIYTH